MKLPIILLATLAAAPAVYSQVFYTQDFSGAVGGEWSNTTTSETPAGARPFLGEFNNATVALSLSGMPAHGQVTFSFDLFVIRTWDGSEVPGHEDTFRVAVGNGVTQTDVLNTAFSNHDVLRQAYPNSLASGLLNAPGTGATEINTLGYSFNAIQRDAVYNLSFTVPHTSSTFGAEFQATLNQGVLDESWGIANVQVSYGTAVPEPGEYAAVFGLGLAGFAAWRRRSRKVANVAAQAA